MRNIRSLLHSVNFGIKRTMQFETSTGIQVHCCFRISFFYEILNASNSVCCKQIRKTRLNCTLHLGLVVIKFSDFYLNSYNTFLSKI